MNSKVCAFLAVIALVTFGANALECSRTIVENILKSADCPTDVLTKLQALSPISTALLHKPDLDDIGNVIDFKCISSQVHAPENKKSNANFTAYYKTNEPSQVHYTQEEFNKCGLILETYDSGKQYQVYFLNLDKVACYYRCPYAPTEGSASAGCMVPIAHQKEPEVVAQVAACKASLAAVGFNEPMADMEPCAA